MSLNMQEKYEQYDVCCRYDGVPSGDGRDINQFNGVLSGDATLSGDAILSGEVDLPLSLNQNLGHSPKESVCALPT